jgi:hypothetical protein
MGLPQKLGADGNHRLRVDVISKWRYCPRLSVIGDRTRGLDREVIKTEPGGEEQCTDVMKIDRPDDLADIADIASQGPRCRRSKISSIRRPPVLNRTRATLDGVSDIKAYISTWALGLKLAMRSVGLPLGGPVRQSFCPLTRCASAYGRRSSPLACPPNPGANRRHERSRSASRTTGPADRERAC